MFSAAIKAIEDIFAPRIRTVLWKSIGLTIVLFISILISLEVLISIMTAFPWPWLETVLAIATGLGLFAAFFFLMAPVTAVFAGLFLDEIAEKVELRDYPNQPVGKPISLSAGLMISLQFGLLVLVINLLLLPTLFFGIGVFLMAMVNAYLLGREYFTMVAMRHMPVRDAHAMRKHYMGKVFAAGLIPAGLSMIPILNILVPLFSTAYFVHIVKTIQREN